MPGAENQPPAFNIVRTIEEFDQLKQEWIKLFESSGRGPQLFQTWGWLWHWLHQFKTPPKNLRILTAHKGGELILVAPLVLNHTLGLKIYSWAGAPVSQYGDILLKDDTDNRALLNEAFTYLCESLKPDLFFLRKVRFDAAITPLLENNAAKLLEENAAPYIEIHGAKDFAEFNKRYSQRSRKSKRRHRRKLEEKGELRFEMFKESKDANRSANYAIKLKRQWLKAMKIMSPAFQGNIIDRFFDSATKENNQSAGILVSQLNVGGRPAAIEIGIRAKNYYGAHLGAYDPEFLAHSPGSLQIQDTIADLIDEGIEIIDLFAPGDLYKYEWTEQSVPVFDFSYSVTWKGRIYEELYLLRIRPSLKIMARTLSEKLRNHRKTINELRDRLTKSQT